MSTNPHRLACGHCGVAPASVTALGSLLRFPGGVVWRRTRADDRDVVERYVCADCGREVERIGRIAWLRGQADIAREACGFPPRAL